ncbi:hypothetical protein [Corynebacterium bovis]|uniref:hypothetical protein n=1 Tax=Corynebacterium bovis TaxID=36808 RepID=UPI0026516BF8|nr:hypothetical protein [Corynebacterium bovis]MDN8578727.1 hypothetical protein [Corynebacterium bovis]
MRTLTRAAAAVAAAALVAGAGATGPTGPAAGPLGVPAAAAQDGVAVNPRDPDSAGVWDNPDARGSDPRTGVEVTLTSVSPSRPTVDGVVTLGLRVRNTTAGDVTGLSVRLRTRPAVTDPTGVGVALVANRGDYPVAGDFVPVPGDVPAGTSRDITLTVPVGKDRVPAGGGQGEGDDAPLRDDTTAPGEPTGGAASTPTTATSPDRDRSTVRTPPLGVTSAGVHPLLVSVSGTPADGDARPLGETRTMLPVAAAPDDGRGTGAAAGEGADGTGDPDGTGADRSARTPATPLTFLWPLAATTGATPGQTGDAPDPAELYLSDDHLAADLREGGRLRSLLDVYRDAVGGPDGAAVRQASCVAVDPELLEVVNRMTHGYRVGPRVPSPVDEPTRLRDRWEHGSDGPPSTPGAGVEDARRWLADLRELVSGGCSVALPYAGADPDALAQTGDAWLSTLAVSRGPRIIHDVLGVWPVQDVVVPGSGMLAQDTVPSLAAAATQGRDVDVDRLFEETVAGASPLPTPSQVTALVSDNTVEVTRPAPASPAGSGSGPGDGSGSGDDGGSGDGGASTAADDAWNDRLVNVTGAGTTVRAVRYSGQLGAALLATGSRPQVARYSNPATRYRLEEDSPVARMSDAVGTLDLELRDGAPVLAVPPAEWSVDAAGARTWLDALTDALTDGRAAPTGFSTTVSPRGRGADELATGEFTRPYTDPGAPTSPDVNRIRLLAQYIRDLTLIMSNDRSIALHRQTFTQPLLNDLLRASSSNAARSRDRWDSLRRDRSDRMNTVESVVGGLRRSVSLLPPGNVFTRTSESSPLLVVARNGLPLPVAVDVDYTAGDGVDLNVPGRQTLPAKGSVTLQMTTDIPDPTARTSLTIWLSTPSDEQISQPVTLQVASVPGIGLLGTGAVALLVVGVGIVGRVVWNRRNRRPRR